MTIPGLDGSPGLELVAPDLTMRQKQALLAVAWLQESEGLVNYVKVTKVMRQKYKSGTHQIMQRVIDKGYVTANGWSTLRLAKPLVWREVT